MQRKRWLAAAVLSAALSAAVAPTASALVVHSRTGHFFGITLRRGISPASIPGSVAAAQSAHPAPDNGMLSYHGGPVLHSSAPYLVFWDPSGDIPANSRSLVERYFADVAADSGKSDDVYGVSRQYYDTSGFADYKQTFSSVSQMTIDTQAYPTSGCTSSYSTCLTDGQLQAELERLLGANPDLPNDGAGGASGLAENAPIYFIVLPSDVDVCDPGLGSATDCADNYFCSYHSYLTDDGNTVLYAAMPMLLATSNPKRCQDDGNAAVQEPNRDVADVVINDISHEDNETITDPLGDAWYDSGSSGNEEADDCVAYAQKRNADDEEDANAFLPTLGGSATPAGGSSTGTLYDQLIDGDQYYTQSEWSNGDANCEMRPTSASLDPGFTTSPGPYGTGTAVTFNPSESSGATISSETWNFGDGATAFNGGGLASVSHSYSAAGTYAITLTLVDDHGNVQTVSEPITVYSPPSASFSFTPTSPLEATSVNFSASASDPNGGTITNYSWNFGDGTTGSGQTPSHTYATYGTYTATLTVTNSEGISTTVTHQVIVTEEPPTAAFTIAPGPDKAGVPVSVDGTSSSDPDGPIDSYSWDFGDNTPAVSGATAAHTYARGGTYTITLTVTDGDGQTNSVSQQIEVYSPPAASFSFTPSSPLEGTSVNFDGTSSSDPDPGVTINSYAWSFGDGTPSIADAVPTHIYASAGTYIVTLTVTNSVGLTDSTSELITVSDQPPTASFVITTLHPAAEVPVRFDGASSSTRDGSITSYVWNFGDGSTADGVAPAHTYKRAGTYRVTLTVLASSGLTATTDGSVVVVPGGRITRTWVSRKHGSTFLAIALSGPGTLLVGSRRFVVTRARTIRVRVKLTGAESARLLRSHRLRVEVTIKFRPQIGAPATRRTSVSFDV